jgi:pimeloyl-ACP methyl ester carboxylesterase
VGNFDSQTSAADLHKLVEKLETRPVHLTGQDISGGAVFRFAAKHPEDVLSLTAIEMGLAGFGLEKLADVTHGGAWHIGALAAPGIPEMLLVGREKEFLGDYAFPAMSLVRDKWPRRRFGRSCSRASVTTRHGPRRERTAEPTDCEHRHLQGGMLGERLQVLSLLQHRLVQADRPAPAIRPREDTSKLRQIFTR